MFKKKATAGAIYEVLLNNGPEDFMSHLKASLSALEPEQRYELSKLAMGKLDQTMARDMVRLLFTENEDYLYQKSTERKDLHLTIECLGYLPSRETVEVLVRLLGHKDETVQLTVAGALKMHTPRLVVPYLVQCLLEGKALAARAGEVLLAMGFWAEDALLEIYPQATPLSQAHILELLTLAVNPKCGPFLPEALKSEHQMLKVNALEAASVFGCREYWEDIIECLGSPVWAVRVKALQALEKLGVSEAKEYVELFCEDEDSLVRDCALQCLAKLNAEA